jgi:chromosome segregation ATPase
MSQKDLVVELKFQIKQLMDEKEKLHDGLKEKDGQIKKLLVKLEQANDDTQACAKRLGEVNKQLEFLKEKFTVSQPKLQSELEKEEEDKD